MSAGFCRRAGAPGNRPTLGDMPDPTEFLRLVVDPYRLAILGAAALGPVDVGAVARALEISPKQVLTQLAKLQRAGLIDHGRRLNLVQLREIGQQLPAVQVADPDMVEGPWSHDEVGVLGTFFRGDRLAHIPTSRSKRLVVLERLAQEFQPGVRYDERHVNLKLQLFHPDYAALRRYMVDEGLLTRAEGVYWRTGGRYEVD